MDPRTTASIVGQVVDAAGQPVADATVMIETSDRSHHDIAQLTGATGEFRFVDVEPGTYTVVARTPGGAAVRGTTRVGAGRVATLRLVAGG
jgi:protocatechuate 3,4-dioxygenase beta subunit